MKINKRREELEESEIEAKRIWRKLYRLKKYGGLKNEKQSKKSLSGNHPRRRRIEVRNKTSL